MEHGALPIPELVAVVGLPLFAATTKGFADRFRLPYTVSLVLVGIALKEL